jgi:hypothetical protein
VCSTAKEQEAGLVWITQTRIMSVIVQRYLDKFLLLMLSILKRSLGNCGPEIVQSILSIKVTFSCHIFFFTGSIRISLTAFFLFLFFPWENRRDPHVSNILKYK